jgi:hypothetical protein
MIAARWRRRQEVLKEDHAHWGMDYDERRRIVYDLLRKHVSHDEAMAYIGRYGLGRMPRSGILPEGGIDAAEEAWNNAARIHSETRLSRGIDSNPRKWRTGEDISAADSRRGILRNVSCLDGHGCRDRLLSFAVAPSRSMPSPTLASDAAARSAKDKEDFFSRFPGARRIVT